MSINTICLLGLVVYAYSVRVVCIGVTAKCLRLYSYLSQQQQTGKREKGKKKKKKKKGKERDSCRAVSKLSVDAPMQTHSHAVTAYTTNPIDIWGLILMIMAVIKHVNLCGV